jgi:hypothetical protein
MTRPSVIDLTITSKNIANQVTDWQILDLVGSDHFGIMFNIQGENTLYIEDASAKTHFRTELANWDLFTTSLKANIAKSAILCSDTLQNIKKLIKPIDILKSQSETLKTLNSTISTTSSRNTPASDFYGQNRRNSNKAPNSSITQIAQLSISATVQENRTNQKERISPATVSVATSPDASIVPFHYLYQDPTGDRARALIAENIALFQKSTDVTCVPPLASQNNSISLPENIGEGSFRASLAPLVTSSPDPANQIPQSQNAELNNSAPNSSIAQIAQLSISATVPDSLENQENSLASNKKLKYYQNDPNPRIEHNLARTAKLLRPIRVRPGNRPRKEPKLTQLERIYKSIYSLYLTSSLEVIKHHYFAP